MNKFFNSNFNSTSNLKTVVNNNNTSNNNNNNVINNNNNNAINNIYDSSKNNSMITLNTNGTNSESIPTNNNNNNNNNNNLQQIFGDVAEPFWVKSVKENSVWAEPDEVFFLESKKLITAIDKKIFWEMSKAIIDYPILVLNTKCLIKNANDLSKVIKKIENKIFWVENAAEILPKEIATDLINFAYLQSNDGCNGNEKRYFD
jgi:hypothetical protein